MHSTIMLRVNSMGFASLRVYLHTYLLQLQYLKSERFTNEFPSYLGNVDPPEILAILRLELLSDAVELFSRTALKD